MRKTFLIGLAAVATLVFTGCKEENPAVEPPVITLSSESALSFPSDGGQGEIIYAVANPVDGIVLNADTDADWLENLQVSETSVTFEVASNAAEDVRTADIVLSYDGAESVKVNVSQASAVYTSFQITVDKLLPSSVTLSCVPSDPEAGYVFSVMRQSEFDEYGSEQAVIDSDVEYVKANPTRIRHNAFEKEEFSLIYQGASYVVYAFGLTEEGKVTSKGLTKITFDAPQRPSVTLGSIDLVPVEGGKVTVSYTVENPIEGASLTADAGYGIDWIHDIQVSDKEIAFVVDANTAAEPESDPRKGFINVSYPEAYNASAVFYQASPAKAKPTFDVKITTLWSNKVVYTVTPSDLSYTYVAEVKNAEKIADMSDADIVAEDVKEFTKADWMGNPGKIEKKHEEYGYMEGDVWEGVQTITDDGVSSFVKKYVIVVYGLDLDGNMTSEKILRVPFETAEKPVITVGSIDRVPAEGGKYSVKYSIQNKREGEAVDVVATGFGWGVTEWVHIDTVTDDTITFTVDKNSDTKGYIDYRTCSISISHADASYGTVKIMQSYPEE